MIKKAAENTTLWQGTSKEDSSCRREVVYSPAQKQPPHEAEATCETQNGQLQTVAR